MALIIHPTLGNVNLEDEREDDAYATTSSRSLAAASKYLGLSNQGATCYMNSLLQTLFMTPEFRKAIYSWKYSQEKDGIEEECIPLQLQRLFGLLQLSKSGAVGTRALTKSFGWEGSEVFQQHDVQELMRVLFDALEETFKGTQYENLIERLYGGKLIDYLKCKAVNYQSEREDKYLDLSLVIRPFGSSTVMHSLDECLQYFLKPEILDGDNKYYCEQFDQKVDAIKGLKFQSLPYILTIQLKRFDYDPRTYNRIKLNDQVRFPLVWDLNKYISSANHSPEDDFEAKLQEEVDRLWNQAKSLEGAAAAGASESPDIDEDLTAEDMPNLPDLVDLNGQFSPDQKAEEEVKYPEDEDLDAATLIRENGEWVYQLYGVLIHSGSALGGHYYAYIRDLDSNKWYNFNDSHVSEISESMIRQAWGGKQRSSYMSHSSTSGANAYMLMYRKVNPKDNAPLPGDELVPEHMKDDIKRIEEAEKERLLEQEKRALKIMLKLFYKGEEHRINAMKNEKYIDLLQRIVTELAIPPKGKETPTENDANSQDAQAPVDIAGQTVGNPQSPEDDPAIDTETAANPAGAAVTEELVSLDCVRLRNYSDYYKTGQDPFDTAKVGDKPLGAIQFYDYKAVCVETRFPDEEWEDYDPNAFPVFVIEYDPAINDFKPQRSLRVSKSANVGELKEAIVKGTKFSANDIQLLKLSNLGYSDVKCDIFRDDSKMIRNDCNIYEGAKLYFEPKVELNDDKDSPAAIRFVSQANLIQLKVYDVENAAKEHLIDADKRWSLARLREEIGKCLQVAPDSFRVHRQHRNGIELKVPEQTLAQVNLFNNSSLYIIRGRPLQPGQHWSKVLLALDHVSLVTKMLEPVDEDELRQIAARVIRDKILDKVSIPAKELPPWKQHLADEEAAANGEDKADANSTRDDAPDAEPQGQSKEDDGESKKENDNENENESEKEDDHTTGVTTDALQEELVFGRMRAIKVPISSDYIPLMDMVASSSFLVDDLKRTILEELRRKELVPEGLTINHLRLRDKVANRMTKILRGGELTLTANKVVMYDNREFFVQILDHEENLEKQEAGDAVVRVMRWDRSKWALTDMHDVVLRGSNTFRAIGLQLSKLFNIDPFNLHALCVSQYQYNDVLLCDLWKAAPSSRPWMVPCAETRLFEMLSYRLEDGDTIIVQDITEPLRSLTPAEIKSIDDMKARDDDFYGGSYGGGWKYVPTGTKQVRKEQGIKIKTRQDRLREAQDKDSPSESEESKSDSTEPTQQADSDDQQLMRTRSKHPTLPKSLDGSGTASAGDWVEASEMAIHTNKEVEEAGGYELFADIA